MLVGAPLDINVILAELTRVMSGVDHTTRNPCFERAPTTEAAATLDGPREPLMQSVVRPIRIASPRKRKSKERSTASPIDLFDRCD
jgi:hypothetical protein